MSFSLNHIHLLTHDMEVMSQFFEQILELKKGYRPPFNFPGAWLWSDNKPLVHLSKINPPDANQSDYTGKQKNLSNLNTGTIDHIAFSGNDYPSLIERLKHYQLDFFERTVPSTNIRQVFVEGPEGLKVEIQFDMKI